MKLASFIDGKNLRLNLVSILLSSIAFNKSFHYQILYHWLSVWILNDISIFFNVTGSYRECFSRSYKLGIRARPIKLTPTCELQRTQRDPSSSIRACLCTTSNCNILDSEKSQFRNTSSNSQTRVVGKILQLFVL